MQRERLLGKRDFGNCGGIDGVYSGELDGASAAVGGLATLSLSFAELGERLLEDVLDRDPVGSDPDAADLFLAQDCEVFVDVSEGGAG